MGKYIESSLCEYICWKLCITVFYVNDLESRFNLWFKILFYSRLLKEESKMVAYRFRVLYCNWLNYTVYLKICAYFFAYAVYYFFVKLKITDIASIILYFGYTMIMVLIFFLFTGKHRITFCVFWILQRDLEIALI